MCVIQGKTIMQNQYLLKYKLHWLGGDNRGTDLWRSELAYCDIIYPLKIIFHEVSQDIFYAPELTSLYFSTFWAVAEGLIYHKKIIRVA